MEEVRDDTARVHKITHFPPEVLAEYAHTWKGMGAQVIGGCCGTGPAHIMALPAAVR